VIAVRDGSETSFYVNSQGSYSVEQTGGSPGDTPLFPLERIDAAVPAALAARIARAARVPESQLHYMVAEVDLSSKQFRWLVYALDTNRVEYFQAPGATGQLLEYLRNGSTGPQPVG